MTASIARARARGSQLCLTKRVPWGKRGRTAPANGDRCVTKSARIRSCAERGTGLDLGEGEFLPVGSRDYGAGAGGVILFGFQHFRAAPMRSGQPSKGVQDGRQNETSFGEIVSFRLILSHRLLLIWNVRNGGVRVGRHTISQSRRLTHSCCMQPAGRHALTDVYFFQSNCRLVQRKRGGRCTPMAHRL